MKRIPQIPGFGLKAAGLLALCALTCGAGGYLKARGPSPLRLEPTASPNWDALRRLPPLTEVTEPGSAATEMSATNSVNAALAAPAGTNVTLAVLPDQAIQPIPARIDPLWGVTNLFSPGNSWQGATAAPPLEFIPPVIYPGPRSSTAVFHSGKP